MMGHPGRVHEAVETAERVAGNVQERIPLGGKATVDGFFEVFNLFNRANYGAYNLTVTSPDFLKPQSSTNLSYAARTIQLGFRVGF